MRKVIVECFTAAIDDRIRRLLGPLPEGTAFEVNVRVMIWEDWLPPEFETAEGKVIKTISVPQLHQIIGELK